MYELKKSELRENIESFAIAVVTILFIMIFIVQSFLVKGSSMEPNLHEGERLLVNKFIFRMRPPQTGDIVVIIPPGDPTRKYIKRVIAGPLQRVRIQDFNVYVDGIALNEPYIREKMNSNFDERTVPDGTIFVMGDNRNYSRDSRDMETVGFVPLKNVVGKAIFVFWPLPKLKILFNPVYKAMDQNIGYTIEHASP